MRLAIWICTVSSFWFNVVVRTFIRPWFGSDFDGRTSSTSLSIRSSSPGRTGRGQRNSSNPAPTMPPAGLSSLPTRSRMVRAAVCQPLATNPWKIVSCGAASSRWKGCGSNSAAKALICSLLIRSRQELKSAPQRSLRDIARSFALAPAFCRKSRVRCQRSLIGKLIFAQIKLPLDAAPRFVLQVAAAK
jgi:hypothetical protein